MEPGNSGFIIRVITPNKTVGIEESTLLTLHFLSHLPTNVMTPLKIFGIDESHDQIQNLNNSFKLFCWFYRHNSSIFLVLKIGALSENTTLLKLRTWLESCIREELNTGNIIGIMMASEYNWFMVNAYLTAINNALRDAEITRKLQDESHTITNALKVQQSITIECIL
ncbi:hypothetical protein FF38_10288 [Lucilia cuprina]|uniref:Uncharacterized protein n=1 Tax=Lucilia cuprina TaxID=7375 RepID=A0A0L0CQL1_LUCCU|nr:hypothetical protein FF38_10288 [Lucilia cuprina]